MVRGIGEVGPVADARLCDCGCGASLEGLDRRRRFFSDACRKASKRKGSVPAVPAEDIPEVRDVQDALLLELTTLKVAHTYEGRVALGLARQLDDGSVRGAAYVALSKEVDRRVSALRLKADLPDDPVRSTQDAITDKRSHLRAV